MIRRIRVCVILPTKRGVLVAQHRFNFRYALPGGGLKKGENEIKAIKRELREELGLGLKNVKFLFTFNQIWQENRVYKANFNGEIKKKNWEIKRTGFTKDNLKLSNTTKKIIEKYESL